MVFTKAQMAVFTLIQINRTNRPIDFYQAKLQSVNLSQQERYFRGRLVWQILNKMTSKRKGYGLSFDFVLIFPL